MQDSVFIVVKVYKKQSGQQLIVDKEVIVGAYTEYEDARTMCDVATRLRKLDKCSFEVREVPLDNNGWIAYIC